MTRGKFHLTVYTDNKENLVEQLTKNLGDKASSIEIAIIPISRQSQVINATSNSAHNKALDIAIQKSHATEKHLYHEWKQATQKILQTEKQNEPIQKNRQQQPVQHPVQKTDRELVRIEREIY